MIKEIFHASEAPNRPREFIYHGTLAELRDTFRTNYYLALELEPNIWSVWRGPDSRLIRECKRLFGDWSR